MRQAGREMKSEEHSMRVQGIQSTITGHPDARGVSLEFVTDLTPVEL